MIIIKLLWFVFHKNFSDPDSTKSIVSFAWISQLIWIARSFIRIWLCARAACSLDQNTRSCEFKIRTHAFESGLSLGRLAESVWKVIFFHPHQNHRPHLFRQFPVVSSLLIVTFNISNLPAILAQSKMATLEAIQKKFSDEISKYQASQRTLQKHLADREQYSVQLNENETVQNVS